MDDLTAQLRVYQDAIWRDPLGWIAQALGITTLWERQREIVLAVRDHPLVAVASANAVGKTYVAALLVPLFLEAFSPAYAITTSSSWANVEKALWPCIRRMLRNARVDLGGMPLNTQWQRGDLWGAFAVSVDKPENFGGYRTDNGALIVVDEASALQPEIHEAIMGLYAGGGRVLMIGNPLRPMGPFYDTFGSDKWHTFHISAFESPNVVQGRKVIPGLATMDWIEDMAREWGEDSSTYQARVLGEFPTASEDTVLPFDLIQAAAENESVLAEGDPMLGVDVGRYGSDESGCCTSRNGYVADTDMVTWRKRAVTYTAGRVQELARLAGIVSRTDDPGAKRGYQAIGVDDSGVGGGVTDILRERGYDPIPITNGSAAVNGDRFANWITEAWFEFKKLLTEQRVRIPNDPVLIGQLRERRYGYTADGKLILEGKESLRRRGGKSPDRAEIVIYSVVLGLCNTPWRTQEPVWVMGPSEPRRVLYAEDLARAGATR